MKNTNKILSFILASAIMVSVFANLPLIKVSAASTKIKDSIVNNFDESGVTYTTNGTFDAKTKNNLYTSRTYNGNTIEYFSMYDTIIDKTTDADGNETWAARFGKAENTEGKSWPNILRLYDSNATDLGLYKPTANTEYTIRFNYKVAAEDVDEKNLMFKLVYENENSANNGFRYAAGNVVSSSVVYIRGTTSKWQTAEATFTTGATVNNLTLMMFSHNAAGQSWWNDETDVWVDNIEIIPARINPEPADFITKEEIYSENFSKYSVGAVPEGWVRDYAFKNLWAANKATAYTSEANVGVTENGTLKYTSATGGHIMTLPATGTDSYYLEVKYKFTNLNGAFGIVTEIDDNYASGTKSGDTTTILSVTPREIYVDSWYDVEEGGLTINTRKYYGNDYQGQDVSPVKYYAPSYFSGAKVATDTEYTLSCYHSGGVSYFYCNNKYVGKVEDYFDDVRTTVGLYNYGASVEITSVKINSIFHASNFEENIPSSSLIMYEDFSDIAVGTDVSDIEGWTQVKDGFTWNGGNGKATVKKFNGINTLAVQAKGGTAALVMPKPNVENYVVSVNVYLYNEDPNGAVGLLTNVPDQINDNYASHATQSVLYLSGNSLAGQIKLCNRTTKDNNVKNKVLSDYTDESLSGMHELELKAYVYDDTSYFFVNGAYIGATKHAYAEDATRLGFYQMFNTLDEVYVTSAKILSLSSINETSAVKVDSMAIRYATDENIANELSGGIKVNGKINTSDEFYLNNKDNAEYGLLLAEYDKLSGSKLTVEELSALNYSTKDDLTETENGLLYSVNLVNLSAEEMSKCYVARAYVKVDNENGESEYYYSDSVEFWPAVLADDVYENQNDAMKKIMDDFYSGTDVFKGSNKKQVKFSLFSDLHYKEGMYIASVSDLENILTRADENEVDFVIQAGDLSNDFKGSPELLNAYLQNPQNLSVYGVYGNHELESGNSMDFVTQKLTNKTDSVVWGTADGKIGDGSIGYYYFDDDESGLRFIFLDTNYSLNPATGKYEHNATGSYGAPAGNIGENSLGTEQLNWFKNLLLSSAKAGKSCVITSHTSFSEIWGSSPDAPAVLEIFDEANHIYPRTVLMAINGHHHTNQFAVKNNILFMDVNTVFNGYWQSAGTEHYTDETFKFTSYNEDGTAIETIDKNVSELTQAKNTYFFTDPLNAIVSISNSGEITVDGAKTTWFKNVVPDVSNPAKTPEIFSGTFNLGINKNFNLTLGNISILGDSYSAYSGYIPEGYPAWYNSDKDVKSVEQTWWKQLIDETDSNLLVNCSYSGSTICNTGYNGADATSTSFIARMKDYFSSDSVYNNADTIFLFGGTNDSWANSPIGELKYSGWTNEDLKSVLPAFCYMISYIKENNPNARIINVINYGLKSDIVSGMKTACEYYGIDCISLTQFSVSEGHPTVDGMTQIKNQIVDYLITKDSANSNTSDDFPLEKLGRKLVWNDEFAGTSLNEEQWTNARLMDNLVATYDNSEKNLRVENNNLYMQVNRLDDGSYTLSESVTTKNRMSFKYGYLEMRAKLPYRHAAWPSLWMLADRDYHDESIGWCAEIDILEVFSSASELSANLHKWGDGNSGHEDISNISSKKDRSYKFSNPDTLNDEYHIYGFAWDKDKMQFFVDGVLYYEILINENSPFVSETYNNTDGFHEPVYIILNNEIFTDKLDWYPENGCITDEDEMPIDYYVDYIRLYQDSEQESIYFK